MDEKLDLNECYKDFMQDVLISAEAGGDFNGPIFTEVMCDYLVDEAVLNEYTLVNYKKSSLGMKVDAWDYQSDIGILNIVVSDYNETDTIDSFTKTSADKFFDRAKRFFKAALSYEFYQSLEESDPAYAFARSIYEFSDNIKKVKLTIVTNSVLSTRLNTIKNDSFQDYDFSYDIWDMGRVCRAINSEDGREAIVIDLIEEFGKTLPILPAHTNTDDLYSSYLLVIPGDILADLYSDYGERLLEQNVRTFLQFRGKVNKGMRSTIVNNPEMFFAFNNGVTATAESIELEGSNGSLSLKSIKNLQIVNGGQTTASLYGAKSQLKADLSKVYVQVKLTVIPSSEIGDIVPKISEFSNTQNAVNAADLSSNHDYHRAIEEISRRLRAPSVNGSLRETYWFYERARGAYANAKYAMYSSTDRKKFDIKNPKSQMFTKTDLAKFVHTWDMLPHQVSFGAQRNFNIFAKNINKEWISNSLLFNDLYFKEIIGKAILFRSLDKKIMKQHWYGGYKINIVAYSISKFRYLLDQTDYFFDFKCLWDKQDVPTPIIDSLLSIAEKVNLSINNPPNGIANVGEWCKKDKCWDSIKKLDIKINFENLPCLINEQQLNDNNASAEMDAGIDRGLNLQIYVVNKGGEYWKSILDWGKQSNTTSPLQNAALEIASMIPRKIPEEGRIKKIIEAEELAISEGFI